MGQKVAWTEEELYLKLANAGSILEVFDIYSKATDSGHESMAKDIIIKAQSFLPKGLGIVREP